MASTWKKARLNDARVRLVSVRPHASRPDTVRRRGAGLSRARALVAAAARGLRLGAAGAAAAGRDFSFFIYIMILNYVPNSTLINTWLR